ncbi:hypothetical protein HY988_06140 [Candidatus Micrarchaeota archaeon]|nr:hypothetical protein [Candidatus Micrarchaeota archaeon]
MRLRHALLGTFLVLGSPSFAKSPRPKLHKSAICKISYDKKETKTVRLNEEFLTKQLNGGTPSYYITLKLTKIDWDGIEVQKLSGTSYDQTLLSTMKIPFGKPQPIPDFGMGAKLILRKTSTLNATIEIVVPEPCPDFKKALERTDEKPKPPPTAKVKYKKATNTVRKGWIFSFDYSQNFFDSTLRVHKVDDKGVELFETEQLNPAPPVKSKIWRVNFGETKTFIEEFYNETFEVSAQKGKTPGTAIITVSCPKHK